MLRLRIKNIYPEIDRINGRQFSAMIVIIDEMGRVLLLHRLDKPEVKFPNRWGFPGGGSDPIEEPVQTVIRETYEETGLRLDRRHLHLLYKKRTDKKNVYFFVTNTYDGEVNPKKVKEEHQNFAWVDPNDLDRYHISEDVEHAIRKAFGTNEFLMG
jgi:8-oxo-dGTP diphosphatase